MVYLMVRSTVATLLFCCGVMFCLSNIAYAEERITTPVVEVIGHYEQGLGDSNSASVGKVRTSLIEDKPILRTGEVLEWVPGMIVTQHSGDGKANQYYLRGFNLDHGTDFATWLDRVPLNMRTNAHGQGYTDLNFLIPELLQSITYKKGPYFADEGDFSSAGAAHLQLRNTLAKGIASMSVGQNGYRRALLADSVKDNAGDWLYALELNRNNGTWSTPEEMKKINAILRYSQGDSRNGFNLTVMGYHNRWTATDQIPLRAVQSGQLGRFDSLDASDGGQSSRYSLSLARYAKNADAAYDLSAYIVRSTLDLYSNFTYFLDDPVHGDQIHQSEKRTMLGVNASKSWFADWGKIAMQNKIGTQFRYDKLSPVALSHTQQRNLVSPVRSDNVDESSIGIYAENNTQWLPKFRTVTGLRFDEYRFAVDSSIDGNSGRKNANIVSPKLSLIFGPWARTEFFINYGEGFHSNDARGTTQHILSSGEAASPVTPLVKTRGSEIGVKSELITGLQSALSLWQLDMGSELIFVGDAGDTEVSRPSRRHGVEWNNHYVFNQYVLLDMDLALSQARYQDNAPQGHHIPGAVNHVASAGITVNDWHGWFGALQMRHFGPRPLIEDNSVQSKATTLTYLRTGYRFTPTTTLTLDIFNLFNSRASDIDYYYESRLVDEATAINDIHFHPVEPRTLRATLTVNF